MRNKHKGLSLVEMVTVIAILAIISIPLAQLSRSLAAGIPNSYKLYQLNTSILNAMRKLRDDTARADDFILENNADGKGWALTLKGHPAEIIYTFNNDLLCRGENKNNQTWELPRVKLNLKPFLPEPGTRAVEVHAYISVKEYGKERKKLENTFLFYAGQLETFRGEEL